MQTKRAHVERRRRREEKGGKRDELGDGKGEARRMGTGETDG